MTAHLTAPQRRAAARAAMHPHGAYENDGSVPASTWRRMLARMWLAGFADEADGRYVVTAQCRAAVSDRGRP